MEETEPTSENGLDRQETVGIIVAIASVATALILLVFIGLMVCKYCFFKRTRRHLRTGQFYEHGGGSGSFARETSREHYNLSPRGGSFTTKFDSGASPESTDERVIVGHYTEADIKRQKRRTYIGSRQFPSENLVLLNQLGEGEYGPVYRGEAYGIVAREKSRIVTVKMLKIDTTEEKKMAFEQEISLFSNLNHLNVVGVLGICTDTSPECIIFDAGNAHVDLLTYVREKGDDMNGVTDGDMIVQEFRNLLRIADEVCLGMAYLSSQHVVHKDLALRNCIKGQNGVVKVASFGLGSTLYPEAYYYLHGRNLPLRWLAPEALNHDVFSTESDVWAFGVLMWELFTYGEQPFPDQTNEEVISHVTQEFSILSPPDKCPDDVFLVMSSCWVFDCSSRPKFLVLHKHIFELISPDLVEDHGD